NGYVTHTYFSGSDIYTVYDTTLQPISKVKFDRTGSSKDLIHKGFIRLKNKAVLLTGKNLNYDKANAVYLAEFDAEALKLKETKEITRVDGNGFYTDFHQAHLGYSVSEDGSKFVVYFKKIKRAYKSDDNIQRFRFLVFDADLKKLWEQDVDFTSEDGDFLLGGSDWEKEGNEKSICIANNGNVYCWGRADKGDGYDNDARYHVKLSKVSAEGDEMVELSGDQEKKIRNWTIRGTETGMIMAANYMEWENTTKSYLQKSDGFAFVSWTGAVKQRPVFKFHEFERDYMTLHQSKTIVKRVNNGEAKGPAGAFEDNFQINGFRKLEGDNYLILAESRHDSVKFNAHLDIDITTYTRRDAHFFSVSAKDGRLNWSTRIPKFQRNRTADGLGYICKVLGDKLYVIFNDHFDNITKEWKSSNGPTKFSKTDNPVVLMTIDMKNPQETVKREKLWKTEQPKSYFVPSNFYSSEGAPEGLLYLDDKIGKERFVKLIFK
ncbi:MAG: hypothetical protein JKX84_04955, partial [Flavobacteriales bacterium]|nr:hypothetical protein [Flavobacteriales bacterium]